MVRLDRENGSTTEQTQRFDLKHTLKGGSVDTTPDQFVLWFGASFWQSIRSLSQIDRDWRRYPLPSMGF